MLTAPKVHTNCGRGRASLLPQKEKKMATLKEVSENQLAQIKDYIESIKYGSVNIIIQDGKIIQIDKSEKIRL